MNALEFLVLRKAKNRFIEFFRSKSQLALFIVFVFLAVVPFISGGYSVNSEMSLGSNNELIALVTALYCYVFYSVAKSGFTNGASMFSMADVNLLFTSVYSPRRLLTYGLLGQFVSSMRYGTIVLIECAWINYTFGASLGVIFSIFVGYGITVFLSLMLAMVIYSFCAGSDKRTKICQGIFYGVLLTFVAYVVIGAFSGGSFSLTGLVSGANSVVVNFFPIAGFVRMGIAAIVWRKWTYLLVSIGCFLFFVVLYYLFISRIDSDYYEDVLTAAQLTHSAITARREGKQTENTSKNIKIGKTGFNSGWGASAIAQKHRIENRRARVFFLSSSDIMVTLLSFAIFIFMRDLITAFITSIYLLVLMVRLGRWTKEFDSPYVYMIPQPPFIKLFYLLREQFSAQVITSILIFIPLYFIIDISVMEVLGCILARIAFSYIVAGVNLLMQRLFGVSRGSIFEVTVYMLLGTVASIPGLIVYITLTYSDFLYQYAFLAMAAVYFVTAAALIFAVRNVLQYSEFNNR